MADEATTYLQALESKTTFSSPSGSTMSITAKIIGKPISFSMITYIKFAAIAEIKTFLNNVCFLIFTDILQQVLGSLNQPLPIPGLPRLVFGNITRAVGIVLNIGRYSTYRPIRTGKNGSTNSDIDRYSGENEIRNNVRVPVRGGLNPINTAIQSDTRWLSPIRMKIRAENLQDLSFFGLWSSLRSSSFFKEDLSLSCKL
ncbi:hypothetical protein ACSBR2_037047 [Camellia fascicularis]